MILGIGCALIAMAIWLLFIFLLVSLVEYLADRGEKCDTFSKRR